MSPPDPALPAHPARLAARRAAGGRLRPLELFELLYKESCPPCRSLSRLVVMLSLGTIRRLPLGSAAAAEIHHRHPEWQGQLLLIGRPARADRAGGDRHAERGSCDRVWIGTQVFRAVPLAIALAPWRLYQRVRRTGSAPAK